MEIKKSELSLKEFVILNTSFSTREDTDKTDVFENYKIEIDFRINNEVSGLFENLMRLNINSENPLPGYSFSVVAIGNFKINEYETLSKEKIANLIYRSTVPMMIANLRAFVFSLTAYGKFGSYKLPSIDIMDLLNKHSQISERKIESILASDTKKLNNFKTEKIEESTSKIE